MPKILTETQKKRYEEKVAKFCEMHQQGLSVAKAIKLLNMPFRSRERGYQILEEQGVIVRGQTKVVDELGIAKALESGKRVGTIVKEFGTHDKRVQKIAEKFGIRIIKEKWIPVTNLKCKTTEETLQQLHIVEKKKQKEIAEIVGLSQRRVSQLLHKFGLNDPKYLNNKHKTVLNRGNTYKTIKLYYENYHWSQQKIADKLGLTQMNVSRLVKKYGFTRKEKIEQPKSGLAQYWERKRIEFARKRNEAKIRNQNASAESEKRRISGDSVESGRTKDVCDDIGKDRATEFGKVLSELSATRRKDGETEETQSNRQRSRTFRSRQKSNSDRSRRSRFG